MWKSAWNRWDKLIDYKEDSTLVDVFTFTVSISISTGIFPTKLKNAVVIPIHKKESKLKCSNFEPISIISKFAKVKEKVPNERKTTLFSC